MSSVVTFFIGDTPMDKLISKLKSLIVVSSVFLFSIGYYSNGISNLFNTLLEYIKFIYSLL